MRQQQWLAVLEELDDEAGALPIPNSFPQSKEDQDNNDNFHTTSVDGNTLKALDAWALDRRQG